MSRRPRRCASSEAACHHHELHLFEVCERTLGREGTYSTTRVQVPRGRSRWGGVRHSPTRHYRFHVPGMQRMDRSLWGLRGKIRYNKERAALACQGECPCVRFGLTTPLRERRLWSILHRAMCTPLPFCCAGGAFAAFEPLYVEASQFLACTASQGGAGYVKSTKVSIEGSMFNQNSADRSDSCRARAHSAALRHAIATAGAASSAKAAASASPPPISRSTAVLARAVPSSSWKALSVCNARPI